MCKNLSSQLKLLRISNNLSQKQLGQIIGLSMQAINDIEHGRRSTTADKLIKIADYFNVSIDYLLGRTDTPTPESVSPDMPAQESTLPITSTDPDLQHLVDIYKQLSDRRQATLLERGKILMEEEIHSTEKKA